jgi:hypothetical protein
MGFFTADTVSGSGKEAPLHEYNQSHDGYQKFAKILCADLCGAYESSKTRIDYITYFNNKEAPKDRTAYALKLGKIGYPTMMGGESITSKIVKLETGDEQDVYIRSTGNHYKGVEHICAEKGLCPAPLDFTKLRISLDDPLEEGGKYDGSLSGFFYDRTICRIKYKDGTYWYGPSKKSKFGRTRVSAKSSKSASADIKYLNSIK